MNRLLLVLGLAALATMGPTRADGGIGAGGGGMEIECDQWTAPEDIQGATFSLGPFPDKPSAEAAAYQVAYLTAAIGETYWPGFTCPGCANGLPGCERGVAFLQAPEGTGELREGVGGWFVDFTATAGRVAAVCSGCP